MNSNFSSKEMAEEIYGILPGDTMELQVKIKNSGKEQTDWYMSNEVLESLEDTTNILLFSTAALVSGLVLLLLGIAAMKKRHEKGVHYGT